MRRFLLAALLLLTAGCAVPTGTTGARSEVTVALVGDILLNDAVLAGRGADYPWQRVATRLRQADLAIGNLETAVSARGTPAADKLYTFRSHPSALAGAQRAGLDVFSLANNHALDYGPEALLDTIEHVRAAGLAPVGAGRDSDEALRPAIINVDGFRVAVLAFTRVIPAPGWVAGFRHPGMATGWEPEPVLTAIRNARARADAVIVLMHWGEEMKEHPRPADADLARAMAKAGATVVAGHHPHVLQGFEWQGQSLIAYSLGNFIFTRSTSPAGRETGILTVTLGRRGVRKARFLPLTIEAGQPRPVGPESKAEMLHRIKSLSTAKITRTGLLLPPRDPFPPD
ncbi:MAG TPA: CapA family protein [Symbiobacteriaceae bacterium]|nr:CapA family protein [Symbiobacteriaceae bacterium]